MIADNEGKIVAKLGRSEGCGEGRVGGREILILWKKMEKKEKNNMKVRASTGIVGLQYVRPHLQGSPS